MRLYLHSLAKSSQPQAKCTVVESKARQSTGETRFNYFRVALVVVNSQLGGKCVARWILMPGHTGDQGVDSVDPQTNAGSKSAVRSQLNCQVNIMYTPVN